MTILIEDPFEHISKVEDQIEFGINHRIGDDLPSLPAAKDKAKMIEDKYGTIIIAKVHNKKWRLFWK